jgi:SAM-dependent methyltransferase
MTDASQVPGDAGSYVLGHTDGELRRLATQAQRIDPITRRFLADAGIAAGARVLDVGSGVGHVAFLAADLVGDTGEVVGVDRSPDAVAAATAEAKARSRNNVSFVQGDPADMTFERPFDAAIGRYVLQFQAHPAEMLRKVAAHVRPGGVVVFHELDWSGLRSFPAVPTYDKCWNWIVETLRLSGTESSMGMKLHSTFVAAGLTQPSMRMEALMGGGTHGSDGVRQLVDLVGTLAPTMERLGVATAAEIGLDTLLTRIDEEMRASDSVILGRLQVGCWSRV